MSILQDATQSYWRVSKILSGQSDDTITVSEATTLLSTTESINPKYWKLRGLAHNLKYNIIEGNDKWQGKQNQPNISASILFMKR